MLEDKDTFAIGCNNHQLSECLQDASQSWGHGRFIIRHVFQIGQDFFIVIVGMTDCYPFMKTNLCEKWSY